jgi:ferric-dicitrate binding protein FerR (iron transport regulator)
MENTNFDIDQLISGRFLDTNSQDENLTLDQWIGESDENRRYFQEQQKLWKLTEMHRKMHMIDEERAFKKISSQISVQKQFNPLLWLQRIAAVLFIPLALVSAIQYLNAGKDKTSNSGRTQMSTVYNTVETPLGMRSSLTLPDGTKVWLNAGSKISYPVLFADDERKVALSGEAYFEVKKDREWPFVVNTKNMNIVVTGTSFNCNAYPENEQVQTVLVEGAVILANQSATELASMNPGELATFDNDNQSITKTKTDLQKYIAWKNGKLMFRDDKMNKVVEKLERWYNVEFEIADKEIADYVYTATFIDESLDQVLKMLTLSAPIRYTVLERKKLEDQTFAKAKVKLYKKG